MESAVQHASDTLLEFHFQVRSGVGRPLLLHFQISQRDASKVSNSYPILGFQGVFYIIKEDCAFVPA